MAQTFNNWLNSITMKTLIIVMGALLAVSGWTFSLVFESARAELKGMSSKLNAIDERMSAQIQNMMLNEVRTTNDINYLKEQVQELKATDKYLQSIIKEGRGG